MCPHSIFLIFCPLHHLTLNNELVHEPEENIQLDIIQVINGDIATNNRMNVIAQNGNDGLHYSQEPSEVKGLDNFEIRNNMIEED